MTIYTFSHIQVYGSLLELTNNNIKHGKNNIRDIIFTPKTSPMSRWTVKTQASLIRKVQSLISTNGKPHKFAETSRTSTMTASAWTILQLLGKLEARVLALGSEQERTTAFVNFFSYFKRICLYYFNFRQPPYAPRTRRHYYYSLSWIKHFWVPEMWLPFLD